MRKPVGTTTATISPRPSSSITSVSSTPRHCGMMGRLRCDRCLASRSGFGRLPRRVGVVVQPPSDDTAHEFRLGSKPELLIEVSSITRLEPDVLPWHSRCQVVDHPRADASATNCGLGPDIKQVGVAHL